MPGPPDCRTRPRDWAGPRGAPGRAAAAEGGLDDLRLAVGEACARAVDRHRRAAADQPVTMLLSADDACFTVTVPVPPVPDAGAGDGVARALRAGPVRLEPGAGAGQLLRHRRSHVLPELRRAVSATDRGPGGARLAGRRQPDRPAAGPARSRPGRAQFLRPHPPAADLAQGRPARGLPDRRRTGRPGPPAQPSLGRGRSAEGRLSRNRTCLLYTSP